MKVTDQQITAAMLTAMEKAVERQTDPHRREGMRYELERVKRGEHVPDDMKAEMMQTIRDFIDAITTPTVRLRRRQRRGRA